MSEPQKTDIQSKSLKKYLNNNWIFSYPLHFLIQICFEKFSYLIRILKLKMLEFCQGFCQAVLFYNSLTNFEPLRYFHQRLGWVEAPTQRLLWVCGRDVLGMSGWHGCIGYHTLKKEKGFLAPNNWDTLCFLYWNIKCLKIEIHNLCPRKLKNC